MGSNKVHCDNDGRKELSTQIIATKREIYGWYTYEFANSAFFVAGQDFISIFTVSQATAFAKKTYCTSTTQSEDTSAYESCMESGWAKDFENSGSCVGVRGNSYSTNSSCVLGGGEWNAEWKPEATSVPLFGLQVGYTATYTTAVTVSIIFQLILFFAFGAVADFGNMRKPLFLVVNIVSSLAISLIYFGEGVEHYEYNLAMSVVSQTLLNYGQILFNAWLPLLANSSRRVVFACSSFKGGEENLETSVFIFKIRNEVSAKLAGFGTACNFSGAILFLALSVMLLTSLGPTHGEDYAIRIIMLICGIWLMVFSLISVANLEPRPGPKLPDGESYLTIGVKQLASTIRKARKLPNLFLYLLSYFIYSDGVSTLTGAAAVFGTVELKMDYSEIVYAWFLVSISAVVSALIMVNLQSRFHWSKKQILMTNLFILGLLPIYAMFALTTTVEFYCLVVIFGLQYSSILTFTRSLFSSIIPRGQEAEFFSLYQLTDKGTAWAGPLLLSVVSSKTGSFRAAFSTLALFFFLGITVLFFFDPRKACQEKARFDKEARQSKR